MIFISILAFLAWVLALIACTPLAWRIPVLNSMLAIMATKMNEHNLTPPTF